MPLLSVVVPAYDVEGYVGECLDSLLRQRFDDLEVIAVDDCSTDGTGRLLDAYAAGDRRLHVLHLPENRGLGGARNAGLDIATGEYVWFVDSDDWVAPGSLATIAAHLTAHRPDLLVLGHDLRYPDGRTERAPGDAGLDDLPGVTTPDAAPALFRMLPSAWSRVVRRELLAQLGLRFPPGLYEDLPVTLPLLCAARRVAVLDEVCLHYRQRGGSILRSAGSRHLEVLDQYELTFERLDLLDTEARRLTPHVYAWMVHHLFLLLGAGRIRRAHRRRYFRRASELARAHRPDGYLPPSGIDGWRDRLLLRGAWPSLVALRAGFQVAKAARAGLRRVRLPVTGLARAGRARASRAALRLYYLAQTRRPVDEHLALYCSYWGRSRSCNPAAIADAAGVLAPWVREVWAVTPEGATTLPDGVEHVVIETPAYYRSLATAKYLISNANLTGWLVKRPGTVFLQTHHGTPLKAMGVDEPLQPAATTGADGWRRDLLRRCRAWDHDLSSNRYSTRVWRQAYPVDRTTLEYGYPRNDVLVRATTDDVAARRSELGLDPDETVVLYAPTHRGEHADHRWLLDPADLAERLPAGLRVLVRAHYFAAERAGRVGATEVVDVSRHPRIEDLYLAADVLVTDYSSSMFDYALLDRPIVVYAPDWAAYREERGTYFDLSAHPPGPFTTEYAELVEVLATGAYRSDASSAQRRAFRAMVGELDDGRAAERVVRKLMLGEEPESPAVARAIGRAPGTAATAPGSPA